MKVLIILGHPRKNSFSSALSDAFSDGAKEAGVQIKRLIIAEMSFEPNVISSSPKNQPFEKDIKDAQEMISWADHLVFVYPTWWGTVPAILKAFFDRVLTAGFAFDEIEGGTGYAKLLKGKTAQLITTMDTPLWIYKYIYRSPGHNAVGIATLKFCGINPVRILQFGPVRHSTINKRKKWLEKTRKQAYKLRNGKLTEKEKILRILGAWIKAIRFQFYPMSLLAYSLGALAATRTGLVFNSSIFLIGFFWVFFLEVSTVLSNEKYDYLSDKNNKLFGPFTGGSRVIVDNILSFSQMNKGFWTTFFLSIIFAVILIYFSPTPSFPHLILIFTLTVLALGYTIPPLKLSYRGLGEVDVCITHSVGVILCGFVFQGGNWNHSLPWLLSIPLFLSIFPSIILAGIPDRKADMAVSKRTLAVRLGNKNVAKLALIFTITAFITGIIWKEINILPDIYGFLIYASVPHGLYLCYRILRYINEPAHPNRIDVLLLLSLSFIMWFVLVPFLNLI
ncbi:NAD(P)H-dependent oxidoreductase [Salegentibacter sp. F14]